MVPPGSFHGNSQIHPPEYQYPAYQNLPQQNPGVGYPMQRCNQPVQMYPNVYQQGPQSQFQQNPYPRGMVSPGVSMAMGYTSQNSQTPIWRGNHQQQHWQPQQQPFQNGSQLPIPQISQTQSQYPVGPSYPGYQPHNGTQQASDMQQPRRMQSLPHAPMGGTDQLTPEVIGHAKLSVSKSAPCQFQEAFGRLSVESEEEAGLKPGRNDKPMVKEMNIPAQNMDEVVKATAVKTDNGNIVTATSSMGANSSPNGKIHSSRLLVVPVTMSTKWITSLTKRREMEGTVSSRSTGHGIGVLVLD